MTQRAPLGLEGSALPLPAWEVFPGSQDYMLGTLPADHFPGRSGVNFSDELNVNVNAAYFPFDNVGGQDYLAGHLFDSDSNGFRGHAGIGFGSELFELQDSYLLNLGSHNFDSCDGILLANGGRNFDDAVAIRHSGQDFEILSYRVSDLQMAKSPFGFVFLPDSSLYETARFHSDGAQGCVQSARLAMSKDGCGTYYLQDLQNLLTPSNSTLLLTPIVDGFEPLKPRLISAEPDGQGWRVEVREVGTGNLMDLPAAEPLLDLAVLPDTLPPQN